MRQISWLIIMGDPALLRLAKRINRRFLYMSEEDIEYLFQEFERSDRIMRSNTPQKERE